MPVPRGTDQEASGPTPGAGPPSVAVHAPVPALVPRAVLPRTVEEPLGSAAWCMY
ncbi:hypothetical protein GCM10010512_21160 [Streptomyces thermoviolaceus subsp. thermoviolaceus]|nr:hypothetical protein GCM10010499_07400 [Streptomyces thermoviolaceus subsp. apingens]GHA89582.1 hypothetical protein GCM10010512_21160 [Streptomyces thermoviolaceus subsp. thermoviolaceus]